MTPTGSSCTWFRIRNFAVDIAETGSAVRDWKVGERVLIDPIDRVNTGGLIGEMSHGGLAGRHRV